MNIKPVILMCVVAAALSCRASVPPQGEIVVYFDTDAPLPAPPGAAELLLIPPLFDTLRVDVYGPGQSSTDTPCAGCTNVFSLDYQKINSGQASIGIIPKPNVTGYRVRARLYRATSTQDGVPTPDSTIDVTTALPPVTSDVLPITLTLPVADVGSPVDALFSAGPVTVGHAESWAGAQPVQCAGSPPPGQVCVPGGAFWMGNPLVVVGGSPGEGATQQRIVILAPFFLDAHEVTVSDFRSRGPTNLVWWTGSDSGNDPLDWCTYSGDPSMNDGLPVNCIDWEWARAYCQEQGADLPSEAQFEYVAGGLASSHFVWGEDTPQCTYARYGVSGYGVLGSGGFQECQTPNFSFGGPLAPERPGRTDRDQLVLPTGTIVDLAGNLDEWTVDDFQPEGSACWPGGILQNPVCSAPSVATQKSVRGASWSDGPSVLAAASRGSGSAIYSVSAFTGFRCARPATASAPDAGTPDASGQPEAGACLLVNVENASPTGPSCDSIDAGACQIADLSGFSPTWSPPTGYHQGLCTLEEITESYNACDGEGSSGPACAAFVEAHGPCFNCINTSFGDARSGPLINLSNGVALNNLGGCLALLEPCNLSCAKAINARLACEAAACVDNCGTNEGNFDNCTAAADECAPDGCLAYVEDANCANTIADQFDRHPGSVCFQQTFGQYYNVVAPIFCGP